MFTNSEAEGQRLIADAAEMRSRNMRGLGRKFALLVNTPMRAEFVANLPDSAFDTQWVTENNPELGSRSGCLLTEAGRLVRVQRDFRFRSEADTLRAGDRRYLNDEIAACSGRTRGLCIGLSSHEHGER